MSCSGTYIRYGAMFKYTNWDLVSRFDTYIESILPFRLINWDWVSRSDTLTGCVGLHKRTIELLYLLVIENVELYIASDDYIVILYNCIHVLCLFGYISHY